MLEVEIKSALGAVSKEQLKEAAEQMGFTFRKTLREVDVYFNGNDRNFMKTDEALRLRSCRDLAMDCGETLITYKGPKMDAVSNTRPEYETQIGDLETMKKLLKALGYREVFTVDKTRREWTLCEDGKETVTLCIDEVKGLSPHMELETLVADENEKEAAVERLFALLAQFGVPREKLTRKSYLEMLMEKQAAR